MARAPWDRRNGARSAAAAVAAVAVLILGSASAAAGRDLTVLQPARVGERIFDFTLPDTKGNRVGIADFRGRVTLLTFWSCHTDTCFTTVEVFEELLVRFGPRGLAAPTICEVVPAALAADGYAGLLQRCGTGQVILIDTDRFVRAALEVRQLPTTILLGRDLVVREILAGVAPLRGPGLPARIERLLAEPAP